MIFSARRVVLFRRLALALAGGFLVLFDDFFEARNVLLNARLHLFAQAAQSYFYRSRNLLAVARPVRLDHKPVQTEQGRARKFVDGQAFFRFLKAPRAIRMPSL